jgi:hypothetical protein
LKLIELNQDSSLIIGPSEKLTDTDDLNQNNDKLTMTNNTKNLIILDHPLRIDVHLNSMQIVCRIGIVQIPKQVLTHWARFSFLRKFFQDVIFMGSSLLVIALNDLFVISYRLVIVLFFVSSHNESFCSDQLNSRSSYFFVLFHIIRSMGEKKKEIPSFFSLILARCAKTLCWLLPENQATKTKRSEPGNSKKNKNLLF